MLLRSISWIMLWRLAFWKKVVRSDYDDRRDLQRLHYIDSSFPSQVSGNVLYGSDCKRFNGCDYGTHNKISGGYRMVVVFEDFVQYGCVILNFKYICRIW